MLHNLALNHSCLTSRSACLMGILGLRSLVRNWSCIDWHLWPNRPTATTLLVPRPGTETLLRKSAMPGVRLLLRNAARAWENLWNAAGSLISSRSEDWNSSAPGAAPAKESDCSHADIPAPETATAATSTAAACDSQQQLQGSSNRSDSSRRRSETHGQQKDHMSMAGAAGTPIPGGKYVMEEELGHGNYGTVYKGRNVVTDETVAIKVLDKQRLLTDDDDEFWDSQRYNNDNRDGPASSSGGSGSGFGSELITGTDVDGVDDDHVMSSGSLGRRHQEDILIREIHAMMLVKHPYIARLLDVTASVGKIFMVMELVSGGDLNRKLWRQRRLDEAEARRLFQQMIDAVHFCHGRGVFHRDLKPDNVLITDRGDVKVADFGLAGLRDLEDPRTDPRFYTRGIGTPGWMSPEALEGQEASDPERKGYRGETADIWSCGVMLFQMLAGYLPFDDEDYPCEMVEEMVMNILQGRYKIPPYFSPGARDLVSRILHKDPATRITMAEIYQHPWFKQDYVAPDFRGVGEVKASLEGVEAAFQFRVDELESRPAEAEVQHDSEPRTMSAFELLAQAAAAPVHQAIAPYFRRPTMDRSVEEETRFTVQQKNLPARELLRHVHRAVPKGFQVHFKGAFRMKMFEAAGTMHEPLCVVAEVAQAVPGTYLLLFRRITGEPRRYQDLCSSFSCDRRLADTFAQVVSTLL